MKNGMRQQILFTGIIGVAGAILMFLYFTTVPINNFKEDIVGILGDISIN